MIVTKKPNSNAKRLIEFSFYASISIIYIYTAYIENTPELTALKEKLGSNGHKTFLGRFKYATFLNLMGQTFYFSLCALNAFAEIVLIEMGAKLAVKTKVREFCNFFYTGLAFPASAAVVMQFWAIYAINREFIYSSMLDEIVPSWLNHVYHTLPLLACVMENVLTRHEYNSSFLIGSLPTLAYSVGYLILTLVVKLIGGIWPYEFIQYLDKTSFATLAFLSILLNLLLYKLGETLNSIIWDSFDRQKIAFLKRLPDHRCDSCGNSS